MFEPANDEQRQIVTSTAPLVVVVGGAGAGKTTSALAAARTHLERSSTPPSQRVLFLSFSRASVARIVDRSSGVLGSTASRVDVTTFHALAWGIVRRFGSLVGHQHPVLASPAHHAVHGTGDELAYDDLLPLAVKITKTSSTVRSHLQSRWGLVIVDEYQDTDAKQSELLALVAAGARRMYLGDSNQCIYASFRRVDGVYPERLEEACEEAGPENTVLLPEVSYRDPSGVIPACAAAIMRREFDNPAVTRAIEEGRLAVWTDVSPDQEAATVAAHVSGIRETGRSVAVFSHHNDMLAALSDALHQEGVTHEIAGLSDALTAAIAAQTSMLRFAASASPWQAVLDGLAVFVASSIRGRALPPLARQIADGTGSEALQSRLQALGADLMTAEPDTAASLARDAHHRLGLPSKSSAWSSASALLGPLRARARRMLGRRASPADLVRLVTGWAEETSAGLLTDLGDDPQEVQLMNLYQTKGRESDATIVVFRQSDFFGRERHPFPDTSRLLYVVFSRAREAVIVLIVGSGLPDAVAPLARLGIPAS